MSHLPASPVAAPPSPIAPSPLSENEALLITAAEPSDVGDAFPCRVPASASPHLLRCHAFCAASSRRALWILLVLSCLCGLSLVAFFVIRDLDADSAESAAGASARVVVSRISAEIERLTSEIDSLVWTAGIALSDLSNSSTSVGFRSLADFFSSQRLLMHGLRALEANNPYLFSSAIAARVRAEDAPRLQVWLERDLLGLPAGALNLTTNAPDGVRRAPPLAAEYWPVLFHPRLVERASVVAMLDVSSVAARVPLINETVSTGQLVGTLPTVAIGVDQDMRPRQVLYQAVPSCAESGLPMAPCSAEGRWPGHALGMLIASFDHSAMLEAILPNEPLQEALGVQIASENGVVTGSWRWPAADAELIRLDQFSVPEFQGRRWTVRVAAVHPGASDSAAFASWALLVGGVLAATSLLAVLRAYFRSVDALAGQRMADHARQVGHEAKSKRDALVFFMRATSHDMRTPLHALSMALEELEDTRPEAVRGSAAFRTSQRCVTILELIVSNVLDVHRAERGEIALQPVECDVMEALSWVVELTQLSLADSEVAFHYDAPLRPPPPLLCDKSRIVRCVENVVSNARKFTRRGAIRLEVRPFETPEEALQAAGKAVPVGWGGSAMQPLRGMARRTWRHRDFAGPDADAGGHSRPAPVAPVASVVHTHAFPGGAGRGIGPPFSSLPVDTSLSPALRAPPDGDRSGAPTPASASGAEPRPLVFLCMTVTDTGAGMVAREVERCVRRFERSTESNVDGTGIGLHVVLASVLAHRGFLTIASAKDVGTAVTLCFPLSAAGRSVPTPATASAGLCVPPATGSASSAAEPSRGGSSSTTLRASARLTGPRSLSGPAPGWQGSVLVVDDQATNAKLLQRQVQRMLGSGAHVLVAYDGRQALDTVRRTAERWALRARARGSSDVLFESSESAPAAIAAQVAATPGLSSRASCTVPVDADGCMHMHSAQVGADSEPNPPVMFVAMDMNMPHMDGLEATRRIRQLRGIPQPRIMVLTGNATVEDERLAVEAGADSFETKPCGRDRIRDHLRKAGFALEGSQVG